MRNEVEIRVKAGTLKGMNLEQFKALQENVLNDGLWDNADELRLVSGFDDLGVMPQKNGETLIYIGIEKDGYTHS